MCCGTGGATRALLRKLGRQYQIIGVDLSLSQLKIAYRSKGLQNILLLECDVEHTPFVDCTFNKVFITHALHEMQRKN